jgi:hypothetical protein
MLRFGQSRPRRPSAISPTYLARLILMTGLCVIAIVALQWQSGGTRPRATPAETAQGIQTDLSPSPHGDLGSGVVVAQADNNEPGGDEPARSRAGTDRDAADGPPQVDRGLMQAVLDNMRQPPARPFYHLVTLAAQTPPGVLEQHARRDVTFAHLWWAAKNEPDKYRGELIYLKGYVRSLRPYDAADNEFLNPTGIKTLYQAELFTDDSRPNPYVVIVPEVAAGTPTGANISENVTFAGFLLHLWVYRAADERDRAAPLLIGRMLSWTPTPLVQRTTYLSTYLAGGFVLLLVTISGALWLLNRRSSCAPVAGPSPSSDTSALTDLARLEKLDLSEPAPGQEDANPARGS